MLPLIKEEGGMQLVFFAASQDPRKLRSDLIGVIIESRHDRTCRRALTQKRAGRHAVGWWKVHDAEFLELNRAWGNINKTTFSSVVHETHTQES